MTRKERAEAYFKEGYNCAQAVVLAFADKLGMEEKTALAVSSSFGGGLGRLREVCGAVSGGAFVLGAIYGYTDPKATDEKMEHYARVQAFAEEFRKENGAIVCRELLGLPEGAPTPVKPEARTAEYYKKRPCAELVATAADIVARMIGEE